REEIAGRGQLDALNPLTRVERQRHGLGLEGSLAAEEIRDRPACLAVMRGNSAGIEPGERADRDCTVSEHLRVLLDLSQNDKLAYPDVALSRLWFWERRASRLLVDRHTKLQRDACIRYVS